MTEHFTQPFVDLCRMCLAAETFAELPFNHEGSLDVKAFMVVSNFARQYPLAR